MLGKAVNEDEASNFSGSASHGEESKRKSQGNDRSFDGCCDFKRMKTCREQPNSQEMTDELRSENTDETNAPLGMENETKNSISVSSNDVAWEKELKDMFEDSDDNRSEEEREEAHSSGESEGVDDRNFDCDSLRLSGSYFKGKSEAIVAKYGLNDSPLSDAEVRDRLRHLLRDLKSEMTLRDKMMTKLQKLKIDVPEVLEQHKIGVLYKRFNVNPKTPYRQDEIEVILKNWEQFKTNYGFREEDFQVFLPYSYWTRNELFTHVKIKFAQYLAQGLPHRAANSVYFKFLELARGLQSASKFTGSDDLLIKLVHKHFTGCSFHILRHILHFRPHHLRQRIELISTRDSIVKPVSKDQEEAPKSSTANFRGQKYDGYKLWSVVTLALSRVLRQLNYDASVEPTSLDYPAWTRTREVWKRLASETGIPELALKKIVFTRLLPMAVHYGRVGSKNRAVRMKHFDLKIGIIEKLFEERRCDWERVNWADISDSLGGIGPVFVYSLFRKAVKKFVPSNLWQSFPETISYMHENVLPVYRRAALKDDLYLRFIPRFYDIINPNPEKTCSGRWISTDEDDGD